MSDFPSPTDADTEFERELLSSWRTMGAPPRARDKALGLVAASATAAMTAQALAAKSAVGSIHPAATQAATLAAKTSATVHVGSTTIASVAAGGVVKAVVAGALVVSTAVVGVRAGLPVVQRALHPAPSAAAKVAPVAAPPALPNLDRGEPTGLAPAAPEPAAELPSTEAPPPREGLQASAAPQTMAVPATRTPRAPRTTDAPRASDAARTNEHTTSVTGGALGAPNADGSKLSARRRPGPTAPDLGLTLTALKDARALLASNRPTEAQARLVGIADDSPLAAEAMALRFDAATRLGHARAAHTIATELIERFPSSPYVPRMRRALATPSTNE